MKINGNSMMPIYIQIADEIENDILNHKLKEGGNCYSQLMLAKELKVNPATAAKGIQLLVARGILEKQRGQAMTIAANARQLILERKKNEELSQKIEELLALAKSLGMSKEAVVDRIKGYQE